MIFLPCRLLLLVWIGALAAPLDEQLIGSIPAPLAIWLWAELAVNLPLTVHVRLHDVSVHHQRTPPRA
jgi:hypothetical protein